MLKFEERSGAGDRLSARASGVEIPSKHTIGPEKYVLSLHLSPNISRSVFEFAGMPDGGSILFPLISAGRRPLSMGEK